MKQIDKNEQNFSNILVMGINQIIKKIKIYYSLKVEIFHSKSLKSLYKFDTITGSNSIIDVKKAIESQSNLKYILF